MSGGSFNYLYSKDLDDLMYSGYGEHWDDMLAELDELSPKAAAEMRHIRESSDDFVRLHEQRWQRLQSVLHAVEWWRSNDWSKDQVDEVIRKYEYEA